MKKFFRRFGFYYRNFSKYGFNRPGAFLEAWRYAWAGR